MGKARDNLSVVLFQVRSRRDAEEQEQRCFLARCGLRPEQLTSYNLLDRPQVSWDWVAAADAVLIGGAGAHSAVDEHPFTRSFTEVIRRLVDEDRPLFGSCWGHQFLATVFDGSVVRDDANAEVGTLEIELTGAGREDPLFAGFPDRFPVHLGHHDRIASLPTGFTVLARSERCAIQALRLDGKPIYGSQFHSEMNEQHMRERLLMYQDEYLEPPADGEVVELVLHPTEYADRLLDRFLTLCT